jgi:hypothetical protein
VGCKVCMVSVCVCVCVCEIWVVWGCGVSVIVWCVCKSCVWVYMCVSCVSSMEHGCEWYGVCDGEGSPSSEGQKWEEAVWLR